MLKTHTIGQLSIDIFFLPSFGHFSRVLPGLLTSLIENKREGEGGSERASESGKDVHFACACEKEAGLHSLGDPQHVQSPQNARLDRLHGVVPEGEKEGVDKFPTKRRSVEGQISPEEWVALSCH